jgi:hypothetical protein
MLLFLRCNSSWGRRRLANSSVGHVPSVPQSIASAGLALDRFAMCLGDSGGSIAFGTDVVPPSDTRYTPTIGPQYFTVRRGILLTRSAMMAMPPVLCA